MNNLPYDKLSNIFRNPQLAAAISLFLVLYTGIAAPKLPKNIADWFGNTYFRIIIFSFILYISRYNYNIALIATIGLAISIQTYNSYKINSNMMTTLEDSEQNYIERDHQTNNFVSNENLNYSARHVEPLTTNEFAELQKEIDDIDNVQLRLGVTQPHHTVVHDTKHSVTCQPMSNEIQIESNDVKSNAQTEIENLSIDSTAINKSVLHSSELTNQNNQITNPNVNGYNNEDTFAYI